MKAKFSEKYKKASAQYIEKNVSIAKKENPRKAAQALKLFGTWPGDIQPGGSFQLANHLHENLSPEETLEKYAEYFANISQEFEPLDIDKLPPEVKASINGQTTRKPNLTEFDVWSKIQSSNKTKSSDLPPKLRKSVHIVKPLTVIYKQIIKTGTWPQKWKTEYGTPIPKMKNALMRMTHALFQ